MAAQIKLLRAIQEQEIERVGDTQIRRVDVRIIAAINVDLKEAVEAGTFRDDLMFRLNVFPVRIPLLMDYFLQKFSQQHNKKPTGFSQRAIDALYEYGYPGNIRELENLVERAVILVDNGQDIDLSHLFAPEDLQASMVLRIDSKGSLQQGESTEETPGNGSKDMLDTLLDDGVSLDELEHQLMQKAVEQAGGELSKAARMLGLTRPQLAYRLKKYETAE